MFFLWQGAYGSHTKEMSNNKHFAVKAGFIFVLNNPACQMDAMKIAPK